MATQEDPDERTRCAKKYIVLLELYKRIYEDFYVKKLGSKQALLGRAETISEYLNASQQKLLDKGINGIDEWDISLFWAVQWRCKIPVPNQLTYVYLKSMKDSRNLAVHDIKFKMSSAEADHFFGDAKNLAEHFDETLKPTELYSKQLRDIKDMNISSKKEDEILEKIIADALLTVVKKDGKIVIHVGQDFKVDETLEKEKLVLVIHEGNKNSVEKIIKWITSVGKTFEDGDITIEYVAVKEGSIIVEVVISTSAGHLTAEKIYNAINAYIQEAYRACRIVLTIPVDVVLFTNDEENQ